MSPWPGKVPCCGKRGAVSGQRRSPPPRASSLTETPPTGLDETAEAVVSRRVGITTRPDVLKKEWLSECSSMRDWELVGPFATCREAEDWEKRQRGCEKSGGSRERDYAGARYGYRFEY